jgi:hypothetical protein
MFEGCSILVVFSAWSGSAQYYLGEKRQGLSTKTEWECQKVAEENQVCTTHYIGVFVSRDSTGDSNLGRFAAHPSTLTRFPEHLGPIR